MAKKGIIAFILIVVAWFVIDVVIQVGFLDAVCKQTEHMWRSPDQAKKSVAFLVTLIASATFVAIYTRFFAKKNLRTGLGYGLLFGIGAGVVRGHGSYAAMPIPYYVALGWFLGSVAKGVVGGAILGLVVRN